MSTELTRAIARRPGPDLAAGLTTADLGAPDHGLALDQHSAYVSALEGAGLAVRVLDPLEGHPDAYFVEDAAVVTPDVAVVTNMGAGSRRGEEATIAQALQGDRRIVFIQSPGTVDGGDVLVVGRRCFVGISSRTNENGAKQLSSTLKEHGIVTTFIPVASGLHLKSDVNAVDEETVLVTAAYADVPAFGNFQKINVHVDEAYAANSLWVNEIVIVPRGFPRVVEKLEAHGRKTIELDVSEIRKMDGGLTCMSLRY